MLGDLQLKWIDESYTRYLICNPTLLYILQLICLLMNLDFPSFYYFFKPFLQNFFMYFFFLFLNSIQTKWVIRNKIREYHCTHSAKAKYSSKELHIKAFFLNKKMESSLMYKMHWGLNPYFIYIYFKKIYKKKTKHRAVTLGASCRFTN